MPSENLECFFLQTHPVAHDGLELDFVNENLPDDVTMGCDKIYDLTERNMALELIINSKMVGNPYRIFEGVGEPKPVRFFPAFQNLNLKVSTLWSFETKHSKLP